MLPGTNNILDQLLGGFEIKSPGVAGATGVNGVSAEGEGEFQGLLFGDLLAQSMTDGEPVEQIISGLLFPSDDQPAAQDEAPAGPTVEQNLRDQRGFIGNQTSLILQESQINQVLLPKSTLLAELDPSKWIPTPAVLDDNESVIGRRVNSAIMPSSEPGDIDKLIGLALTDQNELDLLPLARTEAGVGTFRVLDSKVVDGRLELTAVKDGSVREPVTIIVPEALLTELAASKLEVAGRDVSAGRVARVPIEGLATPKPLPIDDLLTRLNLKTLEVKIEPETAASRTASNPIELTLVAEHDGAQLVIKSKIARQAIVVRSESKRLSDPARPLEIKTDGESHGAQPLGTRANPVEVDPNLVRRDTALTQFTLADRFGNGERPALPGDYLAAQVSLENSSEPTTVDAERKMLPMVKMTLPDHIQKPFAAGGQTLRIKIEPEHLGPARLNLVLRNHVLTARVVVDTPIARMAVTNSLDQLTDQLSRAGIDVDRIDVALSGEGARQQFLDRRPAWSLAHKTRRHDDELESGSGKVSGRPIVTIPPLEYIGADRVNLLA